MNTIDPSNASPDVLFNVIRQLMIDCEERTARGEIVDMVPIEKGVSAFCEKLAAMSKAEALPYKEPLNTLMADLTRLGTVLQELQSQIALHMRDVSTTRKANLAYKTSDSIALPDGIKRKMNEDKS